MLWHGARVAMSAAATSAGRTGARSVPEISDWQWLKASRALRLIGRCLRVWLILSGCQLILALATGGFVGLPISLLFAAAWLVATILMVRGLFVFAAQRVSSPASAAANVAALLLLLHSVAAAYLLLTFVGGVEPLSPGTHMATAKAMPVLMWVAMLCVLRSIGTSWRSLELAAGPRLGGATLLTILTLTGYVVQTFADTGVSPSGMLWLLAQIAVFATILGATRRLADAGDWEFARRAERLAAAEAAARPMLAAGE